MEDFSRGAGPKRAPPQRLYDYFFSVGELNKYVLEQQAIVREGARNWLDLPQEDQDVALDASFFVPDMPVYDEQEWGKAIHDLRALAAARERHLQWQKEIADLKKRTKKGRMSTQISFTPGLLTRPSTIVDLPAARSFKSEIVGPNFASEEGAASATPAATSASSTETEKRFDFPPKEQGTPGPARRRPVTELISLMEKKLPLAVKNMEAVTNTDSAPGSGRASRSMSMSLTPRASTLSLTKKKSAESIISGELDLATTCRPAPQSAPGPAAAAAATTTATAAAVASASARTPAPAQASTNAPSAAQPRAPLAKSAAAAQGDSQAQAQAQSRPLSLTSASTATPASSVAGSSSTTAAPSAAGSTVNVVGPHGVTLRARTRASTAGCRTSGGSTSRPTSGSSRPGSGRMGSSENLAWRNSVGSRGSGCADASSPSPVKPTQKQEPQSELADAFRRRVLTVDANSRPTHLQAPEKRSSLSHAAEQKEKRHEASPLQLVHSRGQPKDTRAVLPSAGESSSDWSTRAPVGTTTSKAAANPSSAPAPATNSDGTIDPLSELAGLLMGKATLEDLLASMGSTFDA